MKFKLFRSAAGKYHIPFASADLLAFLGMPVGHVSIDASNIFQYLKIGEAKSLVKGLENSAERLTDFEYRLRWGNRHSAKSNCRFVDVYAIPVVARDGWVIWDGALAELGCEDAIAIAIGSAGDGTFANAQASPLQDERDELTGLLGKKAILHRLMLRKSICFLESPYLAALFVDIDNFESINEIYGRHMGDSVLKVVATRLKNSLRSEDDLARGGADKFLIVVKNLKSEAHCHDVSLHVANRIQEAFVPDFFAERSHFKLSCSIGVAFAKGGAVEQSTDALTLAEVAMYQAKASGKNRVFFFDKKYNQHQASQLP